MKSSRGQVPKVLLPGKAVRQGLQAAFVPRGGLGFCVIGSRISPEEWVADFACPCCQKAQCRWAFWLKGGGTRRAGARRQGFSGTWFRTTLCFTLRKYSQANQMSPSMVALCERCRRACAFQKFSERDG